MTLRFQGDNRNDEASEAATRDTGTERLVRPEFGPETDIRSILRRHGALPVAPRQPITGEADYNLELPEALDIMSRASHAYRSLPAEQRRKYRSAQDLWNAYVTGKLVDEKPVETPKTVAAEPPTT